MRIGVSTKRSVLSTRAMGNPSFISQLFGGVSPTLRMVHKVREWMEAHACAVGWQRISEPVAMRIGFYGFRQVQTDGR